MARLYADEDFPYGVVEELRRMAHDVLTVQEAGQGQGQDPQVLAVAIAQGRAVLTHNRRHFIRLHRQTASHPGIIICTRDSDNLALAQRIHQAITARATLDNQLVRVHRPPNPLSHSSGSIGGFPSDSLLFCCRINRWPRRAKPASRRRLC